MKAQIGRIAALAVLVTATAVVGAAQIKLGGYKEASATEAGVKSAAAFAVKQKAADSELKQTLMRIAKAEKQVVAGTNYRLCLKVTSAGGEDEADIVHYVQVVVYVDLKGNSKLTSWEDSDCGDDDDDS